MQGHVHLALVLTVRRRELWNDGDVADRNDNAIFDAPESRDAITRGVVDAANSEDP